MGRTRTALVGTPGRMWLTGLAATLFLAACQAPPPPAATVTSFGLAAWTAPEPLAAVPILATLAAPPGVGVPAASPVRAGGIGEPIDTAVVAGVPATAIATVTQVAAAATATVGGSGGSGGGGSAAATPNGGTVTIDLKAALRASRPAARRLLATPTDVDHVMVVLAMAGQPDRVQAVTMAQIQGGASSVTFGSLPAGPATITITAFDAVGTPLGLGSQPAAIVVGVTTAVAIDVAIDPDAVANGPAGGNVDIGVTFSVGAPGTSPSPLACPALPPVGKVVATFSMPCWGLHADDRGHLFGFYNFGGPVIGSAAIPQGVVALRMASSIDGAMLEDRWWHAWITLGGFGQAARTSWGLAHAPATGMLWASWGLLTGFPGPSAVADGPVYQTTPSKVGGTSLDAAGNAYFPSPVLIPDASQPGGQRWRYQIGRRSAAGVDAPTSMTAFHTTAVDATGNVWADGCDDSTLPVVPQKSVRKYRSDEALLGTYPLPVYAQQIKADARGNVWVRGAASANWPAALAGDTLLKLGPDGQVLATITTPVADYCLDGNQSLWVATRTALLKFAPDGTPLGQVPIAATAVTFGDGFVYAGDAPGLLTSASPLANAKVSKIAP